jgi:hypothetical protein
MLCFLRLTVCTALAVALWAVPSTADSPPKASAIDSDWAFKPVAKPSVPRVSGRVQTPVDAFLLARLEPLKLTFAPPADKTTWLRRVTFDLIGLPPTPAELDAYHADDSPDADRKVVDRLLASPQFGERQAQWWLDLVRYADSDGFKADDPRPNAWRYRDYVIASFNADKPYDRFITEQLAGDERFPDDPVALVATGFLRHYPDEYNAVNMEQRRQEILNDIADTTATAFLGLTLGCAKCHDHKFDPIAQSDYYRFQAFFAGYFPANANLLRGRDKEAYEAKRKMWEEQTAEARKVIDEIEKPYRDAEAKRQRMRHVDYVYVLDKPEPERTPLERQIAAMVAAQVYEFKMTPSKMKPAEKEKWEGMKKRVAEADAIKPPDAPTAMVMAEIGPVPPPTKFLRRGNWRFPKDEIKPGYLSPIEDKDADDIVPTATTSGRRSSLAKWIASEKNPLTARVFVNRVWQQMFGTGLVATPGDFGVAGDKPTHPQLLDWLANELVNEKWSVKNVFRQIALSAAYRQSSHSNEYSLTADPENKLLSRMPRKRLDGESLRDAILSVSGQLNLKAGGPGIYPELPAEMKVSNWKPNADVSERNRRSIYVTVKRNLRYPFFALFDSPDRNETCSRRFQTNTAPQALAMLNDQIVLGFARQFADRVVNDAGNEPAKQLVSAFRLALGRTPTTEERAAVERFAKKGEEKNSLVDVCHALLNLNEFLYVD